MWFTKEKSDPSTMKGEESFTFLGKGSQFKGIISFEGTIRMDGRLEGEIHMKGTLVVGEHAVIEGDVSADVVIVGGRITGTVIARDKAQLLAAGVVLGTIKTPLLSVEEGARFMGACEAAGRGAVRTLEGARGAAQQSQQGGARALGA